MSLKKSVLQNVFRNPTEDALNEEWSNFVKRVGDVSTLVRDLTGNDKMKAEAATKLADQYLEGKVISDENVEMKVRCDRTVINEKAFKMMGQENASEMDKDTWMAEVSKDADKRALDRKIRKEKAETFKTQAVKAFRRGEYERALSCYNKAIDQVKDNATLLCDRALTNIKLGNYEKVFEDCHWALRINENSFKARLYQTKAYKELEDLAKMDECKKELMEMFPQHEDLITYFLDKQNKVEKEEDEEINNDGTVEVCL